MGPPSKKRKVNHDSKSSPASSRNLDFFFGKQKEVLPIQNYDGSKHNFEEQSVPLALTDEQLARKLQAEWDQEESAVRQKPTELHENGLGNGEQSLRGNDIRESVRLGIAGDDRNVAESTDRAMPEDVDGIKIDELPSEVKASLPLFVPKSKNTLSLQSAGTAEDAISSNIPFDESPLQFEPSNYVAELQGHWAAEGGDASYALLTRCFVLVNSTQSRIKIVDTLVNLLRVIIEGDPSSLLPTVCSEN